MDCIYLLLKAPLGRESNTVPQGYGKYFRLYFSLIESSAGGGGSGTVPQGYGGVLDSNYLVLKTLQGRVKIQFHMDMECISDCSYLLLKAPLSRDSSTVPQGYGMYFRLKLSFVERSTGGSEEYSSTRIWSVFQFTIFISCWKTPLRRESNTVPQGYGMYFRL